MSILSKVKSAAKKAVDKAKSVVSSVVNTVKDTIAGGVSKASGQVASVYNAVTPSGGNTSSYNSEKDKPIQPTAKSSGGTLYYNNYNPPGSIPANSSSGGAGFGSYGPQQPASTYSATPYGPALPAKTISSGKQPVGSSSSSSINSFGGLDASYGPTQTISSQSFGRSSDTGSLQGSTGSYSPVVVPSNPGSVNPSIDTTAIAGRTAGLYERQADGSFKEVKEDEQSIAEKKAKEQADLFKDIVGEMPGVEDDREVREAVQERQRIKEALQGPTNELNAVIAKQNQDLLQLRQTGSQEGVTEAVYGGQQSAINYNAAIRALPLQASIASLQGDLELATDYLTELRQTKSDQIKRQYEYRKNLFDSIQGVLTKEDQRAYDEKKTENERAYKDEQKLVDFQSEMSMMVMQNAPESVRSNIISRVNNAGSIQDVIQAAGKYGVPANTQLTQLDNGDTVLIDKNTGKIVSNVGGAKPTASVNVASLTPEQANDPFIQKMAKTAGGKPITDSFAQKLNKGLTVLDQLGTLQASIKDVRTGPIYGAFKGANPWDTNAQVIKAQLNSIVPNLARGVYGEVGVLTDNDIAQYSKTLPNLKSTEDIRNAVLGITVDLIGKSIKQTLEVNAANQKDVSGFIDIYTNMQSTRDSIFSQIPGYKGSQGSVNVTPEVQSLRSKYNY